MSSILVVCPWFLVDDTGDPLFPHFDLEPRTRRPRFRAARS
jgi:hypothetical protein